MTIAHNRGGPCIELERSLPSEVAAISPFVDRLMLLFRKCGCVPEGESEVAIWPWRPSRTPIIRLRIVESGCSWGIS